MFNIQNSGRATVKGSANWKSRKLDLGNRHRTTLNFGDLVPAYWQHVQPGDKLRLDATVLAKFMPLIAPAFSRMKIKSEWFYVPLRQIAQPTLRAIQDFKPNPSEMSEFYSKMLSNGFADYSPASQVADDQQISMLSGFLGVPAAWISEYLVGDTATLVTHNTEHFALGSDFAANTWRNPSGVHPLFNDLANTVGQESIVSYTSKSRIAKLLSYMGLPSRLTTLRYTTDALLVSGSSLDTSNFDVEIDNGLTGPYSVYYSNLVFGALNLGVSATYYPADDMRYKAALSYALSRGSSASFLTSNNSVTFGFIPNLYGELFPVATTYSNSLISAIPFQAYQKIYNDFFRDEKLQTEEIRYYPSFVFDSNSNLFRDVFAGQNSITYPVSLEYGICHNHLVSGNPVDNRLSIFFNNLFGLRRRNRTKDVISSCVTAQVVKGQLNASTQETVYDAKLQGRLARYFMKKEFTGSTWAEWLNNFFGVNSNDLLNNNVVFLGGRESVVSISENIQTSESSDTAAQGNRAGLANDFHSGSEVYFRVPDFGVIMCIVSVIPDDIDNFNGLQERFQKTSVFDFNLPDFQNIGYSPVFNRRVNIGFADSSLLASSSLPGYPSQLGDRQHSDSNSVFGFQPFGYSHTYTPNVISGDLVKSLRFWHQSPDLDFDFSKQIDGFVDYSSWVDNQPQLNFNLSPIGMRFQPYGADLKSQYYNNVFAVTNDESGDHVVADMRFFVTCHRDTAFFTDALDS